VRRVTWVRYNHWLRGSTYHPYLSNPRLVYQSVAYTRQPMQRTEYYMPWGTVTVDELHRMD
jgi:hypothetical protein